MSNLRYINSNEELILEVLNFNYNSGASKDYDKITWEMVARGETTEIGTGKSIRYTVDDEYEDEHVTFVAYIDEKDKNRYPQQKINCFVVKEAPKDLQVYAVKGTENASVGETVEFEITEYNVDRKLREYEKDAIKWSVKIGDDDEKVFVDENGEPYQGEQISCVVPSEWGGKEVCVMPYFHSPTERISATLTPATVTEIVDAYWLKDGRKQRKLKTDSPVTLYIKLTNYVSGIEAGFRFTDEDNEGWEEVDCSGIVDENGTVKIEEFQLKLNDNSNGKM